MCAKKTPAYIKDNVTFDFFKPNDLNDIKELQKLDKSKGGSLGPFFPTESKVNGIRPIPNVLTTSQRKHLQLLNEEQRRQKMNNLEAAAVPDFSRTVLVARDKSKNKIIGFEYIALYGGGGTPTLNLTYVHPDYRSKGIASSLHSLARLKIAEAGYEAIQHSVPVNRASVKALRNAGFSGSTMMLKREKRKKLLR